MRLSKKLSFVTMLLVFVLVNAPYSSSALTKLADNNTNKSETISWEVELSHPYVKNGAYADELVNIKLLGREDVPFMERTPVNLVLVIDRSGSMSDRGKINYAKGAARQIIDRLSSTDRLSIVAYSTEVQVVYPMQFLKDKYHAKSAVNSLYPTNSTNLSGGLITAIDQFEPVRRSGHINRVILLSDGLANTGITDIGELSRISSRASERGVQITTMGLGLDYDENLMMSLAKYGSGNYYFIESPSQLASIFHREFGQLSNTIAKAPVITLHLEPGTIVSDLYGYRYSTKDDSQIQIKLGDIFAGQQRDLLLKLRVPADRVGKKGFVRATLKYEDLLENGKLSSLKKELSYNVTSDHQIIMNTENKDVTARGISVEAAHNLHKATDEYESGNSEGALSYMNDAYQQIVGVNKTPQRSSQTLKQEEELREAIKDMQTNAPSPSSESGKRLIKEQKSKSYQYQQ